MKKLLSVVLTIVLCFSLFSVVYAADQKDQAVKEIKIKLPKTDIGTAKVTVGSESFDLAYKFDSEGVLMGNGYNDGVLKMLQAASKLSNDYYDLYIRHRAMMDDPEFYDVIITGYKLSTVGHYPYNDGSSKIFKTIEYYAGGIFLDNFTAFDTLGLMPAPHLFYENGKYDYMLPLRFTFEQLGFNVGWDASSRTITITK